MKFFRYTARDSTGRSFNGTVQAASPGDVQRDLASKGYQLVKIEELSSNQSHDPVYSGDPSQLPQVQAHVPRPRPVPAPQPASPPPGNPDDVIHTKKGTDKQRFFLFSQLASALRAGINPTNAFSEVAQRSADQFEGSLQYAGAATTHGTAISEVFAKYPDLYPLSVVGLTRAGEAAGFLPDAFDEIARQAESAHSFKRWFFWVWFLIINFVLSVPLVKVTGVALKSDWDKLNANGGDAANPLSLFSGEMLHALLWPWGPITLVFYFGIWGFNRWLAASQSEMFRHRLGLKIPVYGKRAWQENLARFSWTMSKISRAGISPARSWQLSAESVPNLAFRDELLNIGGQLKGSEKMSDLFFRSKLFPDEYAPMIASAEYTGDLSGALDKLSQISAGEYVAAQNYAKAKSGCWGLLGCFITSAIIAGILFSAEASILHQIMQDTDEGK